ncbi:hypothetical protein AYK20_09090 [Thermoplasmatales archaeon SG8-52-1]|nr:MAG: hypothetical protein AYK20_09090 [Thermoplasmatales archaeon SG8-52-1]
MIVASSLTQIGLSILYILFPIITLYIIYLILTKAFNYMGFTSLEAIIIVIVSFLFNFEISIFGFNISNIYLFSSDNWRVGINLGGAIIPILLSIYLIFKKKIPLKSVGIGILVVTIIAYLVSRPEPDKGIVSAFPYWLLPAFFASITSVILLHKNFKKAAPLAYVSGTIGVLIGADFLRISQLLSYSVEKVTPAIIGGAVVFDMIFITGIIAVLLDGVIMFRQSSKA